MLHNWRECWQPWKLLHKIEVRFDHQLRFSISEIDSIDSQKSFPVSFCNESCHFPIGRRGEVRVFSLLPRGELWVKVQEQTGDAVEFLPVSVSAPRLACFRCPRKAEAQRLLSSQPQESRKAGSAEHPHPPTPTPAHPQICPPRWCDPHAQTHTHSSPVIFASVSCLQALAIPAKTHLISTAPRDQEMFSLLTQSYCSRIMTGNAWDRTSHACVKTDDTPAEEVPLPHPGRNT